MKANKALKRLSKIEALMSVVAKRYSAGELHIREVLQDAKAAVTRAKEALSLRVSSATAKNPAKPKRKAGPAAPHRRRAQAKAAVAKAGRATRKAAPARKKASAKKAAKRSAPITKAARNTAAKKTATTPAQSATDAAPQEPVAAPPELNDRSDSAYGF